MTHTGIIVNIQIEGLHCWPDADKLRPEVGFLSNIHRHIFHICAKKLVQHDDRDIEIIMFKRAIQDYLIKKYYDVNASLCVFDNRSCEMIAHELMKQFDCYYVSVLEDNENGAEIFNN